MNVNVYDDGNNDDESSSDDDYESDRDDDDDGPGKYVIVQLEDNEPWDFAPAAIMSRDDDGQKYRVKYFHNEGKDPEGPWAPWNHNAKSVLIYKQMIALYNIKLKDGKLPKDHVRLIATEKFNGEQYYVKNQKLQKKK